MKVRRNIFVLVVVFLSSVAICQEFGDKRLSEIFDTANDNFRKANSAQTQQERKEKYEFAILGYEQLIDAGRHNAGIYYNLANAYLLNGETGKAILNYRRAEKLQPDDVNIKKNLAYARSLTVDKIGVKPEDKVLQTVFFWHYDLGLRIRILIACAGAGVFFVLLTAIVWLGNRWGLRGFATAAAIVWLGFAISAAVEMREAARTAGGVIIEQEVVARQGDGENYPSSFTGPLHEGTEFILVEKRSGWFHIQLADGSRGWIPDISAEII